MRPAPHHALASYLLGRPGALPNGPSAQGPRVVLAPDPETTADLPPGALYAPLADLPAADPGALDAARRALAALELPAVSAETSGRGAELVGEALGHLRAAVVGALASAGARPSAGVSASTSGWRLPQVDGASS